jgi:hypothetical protein
MGRIKRRLQGCPLPFETESSETLILLIRVEMVITIVVTLSSFPPGWNFPGL